MSTNLIVYALFFVSVSLLIYSLQRYTFQDRPATRQVNRRLTLMETMSNPQEVFELLRRERGIFGGGSWAELSSVEDWLVQTGLRMRGIQLLMGMGAICGGALTLGFMTFGAQPLALFAALGLGLAGSVAALHVIRNRRIARFQEQLPEVIDVMVRSVRTGHSVPAALAHVAKETADPAGTEFGIASDEVAFGVDVTTAVRNLARRVGDHDLLYVLTAIAVQAQTGGNLAEVLAKLSQLLRERLKLRLKVHAMTSEARLSAVVLSLLPAGLYFFISWFNPQFYGDLWNDPLFRKVMYSTIALVVIGNIIMRRMAAIKY